MMMARHIADSTAALLLIHQALAERPALDGTPTALAFLPEKDLASYDFPLGDVVA
jgi:hypothetical protein